MAPTDPGRPLRRPGWPQPRYAPGVEGGPGAQVVRKLPQPVLHLGAHGKGAVDAVRTVRRCFPLATPDAHVTGETGKRPTRLRLERLVDTGLPPRIRNLRSVGGDDRCDRVVHFRLLRGGELDVHAWRIIVREAIHPFEGFRSTRALSPLRVMPVLVQVTETHPQCGT
jgi:hypothetical protein